MDAPKHALSRLKAAFGRQDLTLLVGAGASIESGLPSWPDLLASVFINSLGGIHASDTDLLQATAESWIAQVDIPLEIVARHMRVAFSEPEEFLKWVRFALYKWVPCRASGRPTQEFVDSLQDNKTLSAIASLCERSNFGTCGLRRIISYNFDDLLELRLGNYGHQSIWSPTGRRPTKLPIYHVHGFLPTRFPWSPYPRGRASEPNQIVLTEDQYHREASQPYGWSNLLQLQSLADSICLTVGLSMSDPNMRRILDISASSASRPEVYALLPMPRARPIGEHLLGGIFDRADALRRRGHPWTGPSGKGPTRRTLTTATQAQAIWTRLDDMARTRQIKVMKELGIHPIWCAHEEIPNFFAEVTEPLRPRTARTK